jgi:membrane protein YdbS with pleckstrin-like domain
MGGMIEISDGYILLPFPSGPLWLPMSMAVAAIAIAVFCAVALVVVVVAAWRGRNWRVESRER